MGLDKRVVDNRPAKPVVWGKWGLSLHSPPELVQKHPGKITSKVFKLLRNLKLKK